LSTTVGPPSMAGLDRYAAKPRERGWEIVSDGGPAVNGGPRSLRGEAP
jgi:hypothetical protein